MQPLIRQTLGWAILSAVVVVVGLAVQSTGSDVGLFLIYFGGLIFLVSIVFIGVELTKSQD